MTKASANTGSQETELKLALPSIDPSILLQRLRRVAVLARRTSTRLQLNNVYFDTPDLVLRRQRVALRIRCVGDEANPQWLQTLKTAGRTDSALSQRGEWETPLPGAKLSLKALKKTPWPDIDANGEVFRALTPVFETNFERTLWLVRRRDGSVVEVALDLGQILAGGRTAPICELELELKAGQPQALFDIARQIAESIALIPAAISKAERGYALAQGSLATALRAAPQALSPKLSVAMTAQRVLSEMFSQFTGNLNTLLVSDDPEVVHQARVGWRRLKSARRLFAPVLVRESAPDWQALHALLICLGKLRDLDVARTQTLPPLADVYVATDPRRAEVWQQMMLSLAQAVHLQRKAVRYALQDPAVGTCLLATTQWLGDLTATGADARSGSDASLQRWTQERVLRLHQKVQMAQNNGGTPEQLHRVRILAKRMRYNLESLEDLLPRKRAQRWRAQAIQLQTSLGDTRDAIQAISLLIELGTDRGLTEFLRGHAIGQKT